MVIEKKLKCPKEVTETVEKQAERASHFLKNRNLRLSDQQKATLKNWINKRYSTWKKNTQPLRKRLSRWNDLLEGVVEDSNFPFEGSSNITIHLAMGMMRGFRSTFNKTNYQDKDIAIPILAPALTLDANTFKALQDGFNYTFSDLYKIIDVLKDGTVPCARDGTLIISEYWDRKVETTWDQRVYREPSEFIKDYPDAEAAGVDDDEFKSILDNWIMDAETELVVSYDHDFVKFDGIKAKINPLAKFVTYPTFQKQISEMEIYGPEYEISRSDLKIKKKRGEFYEAGVDSVLNVRTNAQANEWDKGVNFIVGISRSMDDESPVMIADLVVKYDMDGNGIPEKYIVCYAPETETILSVQQYKLRNNIDMCVEFRFWSRESSFYGNSLIGDGEDIFNQLDVLHRHRNNIRMLCTAPVFLGKNQYKDLIDMGRAENVIRPGLTLWVDDLENSIKQLPIQNLDQPGNSMDEENALRGYLEMLFGPTQGQSGQQTPDDPHAPARKTQMMLMQANQRVDDYGDEFRKSLPALFKLHATLLYQFADKKDMDVPNEKNDDVFKFPIQMLGDDRISWEAKRRSVNLTPEFAMARMSSLMAIYAQLFQLIKSGDKVAIELWNRQVKNSGEPDSDKLIIDEQQSQGFQQQAQQAQQQMEEKKKVYESQLAGQKRMMTELGRGVGQNLVSSLTLQQGESMVQSGQVPNGQANGQPNGMPEQQAAGV